VRCFCTSNCHISNLICSLASFGLDADPNHFNRRSQSVPGNGAKKDAAFMGFAVIPESDDLTERNPRRRKMSEHDQKYVANCIKKYGSDYKKMERDMEINSQQYTEAKMKNLCSKYLSLGDHERLVNM
jgi:Ribosome biogenesis protein Nop16